jgi:hypothetical protein
MLISKTNVCHDWFGLIVTPELVGLEPSTDSYKKKIKKIK